VGQSYFTSAFTTLYSLLVAARVVLRHKPQLVSTCQFSRYSWCGVMLKMSFKMASS
jgi:hypothetical protein